MNSLLWVLQAALVLILVPAAITRAVAYDFAKTRMAWVAAVPRPLLLFISFAVPTPGSGRLLVRRSRPASCAA